MNRHRASAALRFVLAAAAAGVLAPHAAFAHDARPLSITIVEQPGHVYRVDTRMPPAIDASNRPWIVWPAGCDVRSSGVRDGDVVTAWALVGCQAALDGQRVSVHYPLFNPSLATLFRFTPAAGATRTAVLPPDRPEWQIPAAANWKTVAEDYLMLGIAHIWAGIDHLLFVTGLLLLAGTARRITLAITGFTLAHSVTLSAAALGLVRVPVPPVEAAIALSILFLAREVACPDPTSIARGYPLAVSSTFGLLHGFGFAAALADAGLPRGDVAPALFCFNVGVEIGQLAFIAVLLVVAAAAAAAIRAAGRAPDSFAWLRGQTVAAYALGIPASYWFIQRLDLFWPAR